MDQADKHSRKFILAYQPPKRRSILEDIAQVAPLKSSDTPPTPSQPPTPRPTTPARSMEGREPITTPLTIHTRPSTPPPHSDSLETPLPASSSAWPPQDTPDTIPPQSSPLSNRTLLANHSEGLPGLNAP